MGVTILEDQVRKENPSVETATAHHLITKEKARLRMEKLQGEVEVILTFLFFNVNLGVFMTQLEDLTE